MDEPHAVLEGVLNPFTILLGDRVPPCEAKEEFVPAVNLAMPRQPQHRFRGTHNPSRREVSLLSTVNRLDLTASERSVPPASQSQEFGLGGRVDLSAFNAEIRTRSEMFGTL